MSQRLVYYVEDDTNIRELTLYALEQAGVDAEGMSSDAEFRAACARRIPDAVLLDIMLPDTDGMAILKRMRKTPGLKSVPVMMMTAKDAELDTVTALDAGADDYLTKPFGMMEMVSRVRALLRRSRVHVEREATVFSEGPLTIDTARREVLCNGKDIALTMREFDLLSFLIQSPGVVFTREELLQRVWGWDFDGGSRTVDVHVQTIRQKLGDAAKMIETVRGVGYRLKRLSKDK